MRKNQMGWRIEELQLAKGQKGHQIPERCGWEYTTAGPDKESLLGAAEAPMVHPIPTAFFSYSRKDSEFALRLAEGLRSAGAFVWLDQLDIQGGERWDSSVEDALTKCPRMLVILSPDSVASTNVMDEVSYALEEKKTVIPILYRACKIPFRLRRVQYIDCQSDYNRGLRELLTILGGEIQLGPRASVAEDPAIALKARELEAAEMVEKADQELRDREAADARNKADQDLRELRAAEARRAHPQPPVVSGDLGRSNTSKTRSSKKYLKIGGACVGVLILWTLGPNLGTGVVVLVMLGWALWALIRRFSRTGVPLPARAPSAVSGNLKAVHGMTNPPPVKDVDERWRSRH